MPQPSEFQSLVDVIDRLRAPDGCPWDREQTHLSVRDSLLEECYEVLEAIDSADMPELKTELGDLLMQVVFHSRIAAENGDFTIGDVIEGIVTKLIRRHPHIFGDKEAANSAEVLRRWEDIKKAERPKESSMLDGVPKAMPALAYSQEIQGRVARVGFDWKDDAGVLDKLAEEVAELKKPRRPPKRKDEFGDILFTLVNYGRRAWHRRRERAEGRRPQVRAAVQGHGELLLRAGVGVQGTDLSAAERAVGKSEAAA